MVCSGIRLKVVGEAGGIRVVEARTSEGPAEFCPSDPGSPVDGWDPTGVRPLVELWGLVAVGADVVVKPWCCSVLFSCVRPSVVVV